MVGAQYLESDHSRLLPRSVSRTEKAGRFSVITDICRYVGETFERVCNGHVAMRISGDGKRE